ncbi:MAG: hypothetical protein M0P31_04825 [Solirubrobacteraceae bacterium]|nr:hypothetical protein [Solirubrobacteraceae bacterium]
MTPRDRRRTLRTIAFIDGFDLVATAIRNRGRRRPLQVLITVPIGIWSVVVHLRAAGR